MDFAIDLINFCLNVMFYSAIVWLVFTLLAVLMINRDQARSIVRDLEQERLIPLTVEVDLDQYFCYNSITKAFVCQGHNLKEIAERFKQRYPDKSAAIYNGDETAVRILKSQLETLKLDTIVRP